MVVPDFSTVLAMNKNKQPVILAQLRRIYDGSFAREFGTAENLLDRKCGGADHASCRSHATVRQVSFGVSIAWRAIRAHALASGRWH